MTGVREPHDTRDARLHPAGCVFDFVNGHDGVKFTTQKKRWAPNRGNAVSVVVLQVFVTKEVFGHTRARRHNARAKLGTTG